MCGGTSEAWGEWRGRRGLSPRVRGNPPDFRQQHERPGSIPACAGEPPPCGTPAGSTRVYPRVCGGTAHERSGEYPARGLSPRVRGNPVVVLVHAHHRGSIPACAGEPRPVPRPDPGTGVYPRVCGGTCRPPTAAAAFRGLSPRVRGNPAGHCRCRRHIGSIPACAGEPIPGIVSQYAPRVYPRVCGGTDAWYMPVAVKVGLSPRVRGNLLRRCAHLVSARSIPACAGEPADTGHWR